MNKTCEIEEGVVADSICCGASPLRLRRPNDACNISRFDLLSNHRPSTVPSAVCLESLLDRKPFVKNPKLPKSTSHLNLNKAFANFDFEKLWVDCCPQRMNEIKGIGALVTSPSKIWLSFNQTVLTWSNDISL